MKMSGINSWKKLRRTKKMNRQELNEKLNERRVQLITLIQLNSRVHNKRTTQREIYDKLKCYGYEWNDNDKCHDHCPQIWNDIASINMNMELPYLVLSHNFEYWLGNKEETEKYLDKLFSDLKPRLKRVWRYIKKVNKNGSYDLFKEKFFELFKDNEEIEVNE